MKLYIRLLKYLKPLSTNIIAALVCIVLLSACNIALIPIASNLTKALAEKNFHLLNMIAVIAIIIYFFKSLLSYGQVYLMSFAGQRMIIDLRKDLYKHIQTLSFDFFSKWRVGDVMSRIMNDTGSLQNAMLLSVTEILPNVLTLFGALIYLLKLNFRLTLLTLLVAPVITLTISRFSILIREAARQTQKKAGDIYSILAEKVAGIRVIKSFTTEQHEVKRFGEEMEKSFWLTMREIQIDATQKPLLELIQAIAVVIVIWYGAYQVVAGQLSVNNLIAFFVGVGLIATPISTLGKITIAIQRSMSAAERIFEVMDTKPTVSDPKDGIELPSIKGEVEFKNVDFHYEKGTPILNNVSVKTKPGEIIALVGRSGAGKTTFVNLIPRFYDTVAGSVLIDGTDVKKCRLYSLRKQVGIVHQETVLFLGTIKENISYGRFDATDDEIISAAKAANIHDFIMSLPNKYGTIVGERGSLLSGGEKQRVSIARAILRDPKILILDEATSSLDTESERLVQDALEKLIKGRTTFIIAHRLSTVQIADRILVFDKGSIIEEGSHRELIAKGGKYKMLYDMQFRDDE
ncbi:MAG: ABC transporter ATP-binding protein [bacterium]